jgi:transcription initiation factor TFIID TATA-box-binding protein
MVDIIIENIVSTTKLTDELNIQQLANKIENSKYDPNEFPGLIFHYSEPKTVAFLFPSGKLVCTGAKNIKDAKNVINKTKNNIQNTGLSTVREPEIEIQNIVSSSDVGRKLNLKSIVDSQIFENVEYNPEEFPGLIYKMDDLGMMSILFESGKIINTGAKKLEDAALSINAIKDKLSSMEFL